MLNVESNSAKVNCSVHTVITKIRTIAYYKTGMGFYGSPINSHLHSCRSTAVKASNHGWIVLIDF